MKRRRTVVITGGVANRLCHVSESCACVREIRMEFLVPRLRKTFIAPCAGEISKYVETSVVITRRRLVIEAENVITFKARRKGLPNVASDALDRPCPSFVPSSPPFSSFFSFPFLLIYQTDIGVKSERANDETRPAKFVFFGQTRYNFHPSCSESTLG